MHNAGAVHEFDTAEDAVDDLTDSNFRKLIVVPHEVLQIAGPQFKNKVQLGVLLLRLDWLQHVKQLHYVGVAWHFLKDANLSQEAFRVDWV